jgi:hypothetical protein
MKAALLLLAFQITGLTCSAQNERFNIAEELFPTPTSTELQDPTPEGVACPFRWVHLMVDSETASPGIPSLLANQPFQFVSEAYGCPYWWFTKPSRLYWLPCGSHAAIYSNIGYQF